jgi:hypothetical protein
MFTGSSDEFTSAKFAALNLGLSHCRVNHSDALPYPPRAGNARPIVRGVHSHFREIRRESARPSHVAGAHPSSTPWQPRRSPCPLHPPRGAAPLPRPGQSRGLQVRAARIAVPRLHLRPHLRRLWTSFSIAAPEDPIPASRGRSPTRVFRVRRPVQMLRRKVPASITFRRDPAGTTTSRS